jgi:rubrerythrin
MDAFSVCMRGHSGLSSMPPTMKPFGGTLLPTIPAQYSETVANLLSAFAGESNANAKYVAFAVKADADGWHGAASLFRAAAQAEQIHAANHARVLRQLGAEAACEIHPVKVKSTLENLRAALTGEQYEIDTMYPNFVREAGAESNPTATRTFTWAMEAEKSHARLYAEAITLVKAGKRQTWVGTARDFYVCTACGYTSETPGEHELCPVCNLPWEKFDVIR